MLFRSAETKEAVEKDKGTEAINAAVDRLTKATHRMTEILYQQAGANAAAPGGTGSGAAGSSSTGTQPGGAGDVIDAEIVDSDDKN